MSIMKYRSGASREDVAVPALDKGYVSPEERSAFDLLKFARDYAGKVRFYNENNGVSGFWNSFLDFTDGQLRELVEFLENPSLLEDDDTRRGRYSRPHLALLAVFLKLLESPKKKFESLTEKKIDYFYRRILGLSEKAEVPDHVHVIFKLTQDVRTALLEKGTLLDAGKDSSGKDIHFELQEDIVLNRAELKEVKTIHFKKNIGGIKEVHTAADMRDEGFEKMLCLVLGTEKLPDYRDEYGGSFEVDAIYLRTDLYKRIEGKSRDQIGTPDKDYILEKLCFRHIKDFQYCLSLYYREMNRGYVGVTYPEEREWEKAYALLNDVYRERLARKRREELRGVHKTYGFNGLMEFVFGEPEPWNMLYKFPGEITSLEELAGADTEAARQYIEKKLCLTPGDFRIIMEKYENALTSIYGEEIYTLLEAAWTKKRDYQYPPLGEERIEGFYADTILDEKDEEIKRFQTFGKSTTSDSSDDLVMGFAVSSPLLQLYEGERDIDLILSCRSGSIDYDRIVPLLETNIFKTDLSVSGGYYPAESVSLSVGKFRIKPEIKTLNRNKAFLFCDTDAYRVFDDLCVGNAIVFPGSYIYKIESFDPEKKQILIKTLYGNIEAENPRLITRFIPRVFVAELPAIINAGEYALSIETDTEVFDDHFAGKYFVDAEGHIYFLSKIISAQGADVQYCGSIRAYESEELRDRELLINKIWERIEPEYRVFESEPDLDGFCITGAASYDDRFFFEISGRMLKIRFPEETSAADLVSAWEEWLDDPLHNPGRYQLFLCGDGSSGVIPSFKELEDTGKIIKRYEGTDEKGLQVLRRVRPTEEAYLEIDTVDKTLANSSFLIAGDTLHITPGAESYTVNQVAAEWELWSEGKDLKGFELKSKDLHFWAVNDVSEWPLEPVDKEIKRYQLHNIYGNGIRVWYTGPVAHQPLFFLKENEIDLYEFELDPSGLILTIKYPSFSDTSANDLIKAWEEWKSSELNDPGSFDIEQMGDGLWRIAARTEKDLTASENNVIECSFDREVGITAMFRMSGDYENAIVEFREEQSPPGAGGASFLFTFSDVVDSLHNDVLTRKLVISYPPLPLNNNTQIQEMYQKRHVQELLSAWNRLYEKNGLYLVRNSDEASWALGNPQNFGKNFLTDLSYVSTVHPDGFRVKYKPAAWADPFTNVPGARVVVEENNADQFDFSIQNDYPENLKYFYIKYPVTKKLRTVEELLAAWEKDPLADQSVGEFFIEGCGNEKWPIEGVSSHYLTNEENIEHSISDPIMQHFFEYKSEDVDGLTINYAGPVSFTPRVTLEENSENCFDIILSFFDDAYNRINIAQSIVIRYPPREDKRRLVDLLKVWYTVREDYLATEVYPSTGRAPVIGFSLFDTSPSLSRRHSAPLLITGDKIREFRSDENGIGIRYVGFRPGIYFDIDFNQDFTDEHIGRKIVWDRGQIFSITEKLDNHNILLNPGGNIPPDNQLRLYDPEALCLDAFRFKITLGVNFPPVVSPVEEKAVSSDPVIRFFLDTASLKEQSDTSFYDYFKSVIIERIDLKVAVQGVRDIKMRGDLAMINPANPFYPFGAAPAQGALFYFANKEVCEKKLDSLAVKWHWEESELLTSDGIPDMKKWYYSYSRCNLPGIGTVTNADFETSLQFLDLRSWIGLEGVENTLFSDELSYRDFDQQTYQGAIFSPGQELPRDPRDWPRHYKMELGDTGFMKDAYDDVLQSVSAALKAMALAEGEYDRTVQEIKTIRKAAKDAKIQEAEARAQGNDFYPPILREEPELPFLPEDMRDISKLGINAPYTPAIQFMSLDYTASGQICFLNSSEDGYVEDDPDRVPLSFFRFHPFGYEEVSDQGDDYLLPVYEKEGYLFLGFSGLEPENHLSLLVQMVSGSGDVNLLMPGVSWSYLSSNSWIPFNQDEVLKDTTAGLQDTGIIRFKIPGSADKNNTILSPGLIWLRAEGDKNISAVPDILDIQTQAVRVTYKNKDNDPSRLEVPLEAESIKKLVTRNYSIKEVKQPYSSFDGKRIEQPFDFYQRVSEMLKHKNRALILDDYEKLVLRKFPQVYKVKCLPQEELELLESSGRGHVLVIVILQNSDSTPFFPLKPKTPVNVLEEVENFLRTLMPPLVTLTVRNPRFEEIKYRLAVKFRDGYDQGYCINKLNEDIIRLLSPWAYAEDGAISFGSTVYSSSVINHIEKRDYVDYVANFTLLHQIIKHEKYTEVIPLFLTEDNAASAQYPDSVLVSAENHIIDVISGDSYDATAFRGIGYMKIGTDFWISRPGPVFSVGMGEMEMEAWPVMRYCFYGLRVDLSVTGHLQGGRDITIEWETALSREDSQFIWNALNAAGYLDENGNVFSEADLYAEDFALPLGGGLVFIDFLNQKTGDFIFQSRPEVQDFDPGVGEEDAYSYEINAIVNTESVKEFVLNILKTGLEFTGRSQYPFMVY